MISQFLPYGKQNISQEDIDSVVDVLKSDWLTQGPNIQEFEGKLAEYCNAKYAVVCSNGTQALHLACLATGLGKGDLVVTTPNTFLASANCSQYVGAETAFVDIDEKTYNLSAEKLAKFLETNKVSAVIPVDFAGQSCDFEAIAKLKEKYGFTIIEDSCHAIGGSYKGNKIGSCAFSDMSIFSFHPVKHITTGEGGAVTTNDEKLYEKLLLYRNHGMHKDSNMFVNKDLAFDENGEPNLWYYEMSILGYNYRITNIQCAMGIKQLSRLEKFIERRRKIVRFYNDGFKENKFLTTPFEYSDSIAAYHLYVLKIEFEKIGKSRNQVMKELRDNKIGTQVHYIPIHLQPYYSEKYGYKKGDFPVAEEYYSKCLSIPMYYSLSNEEVKYVIETINEVVC